MGSNAEVAEAQVDGILLSGIKVELVSMEECWQKPRGKGVGSNSCVGR